MDDELRTVAFEVRGEAPVPRFDKMLVEQFGGVNGELQARMPEPTPLRLVDNTMDSHVTILHLTDKTCKWPIGDPMNDDFCFCGHGPWAGSPYCEYHAHVAYQPQQSRMRTSR